LEYLRRSMQKILTSVLVLLSASAYAQDMPGPKGPMVTMAPAPLLTVMQGKTGTIPLSFRVANGYHINSSQPKSEFLIPTTLKVDATTDIVIGKVVFPAGQDMSFPFSPDEKLNVYTGDFRVNVVVHPLHSVQKGKYIVRGTLKYQA